MKINNCLKLANQTDVCPYLFRFYIVYLLEVDLSDKNAEFQCNDNDC